MIEPICTMTIAGFDGCGGAGLQTDLRTFHNLNCYGLSVLTALTVQNTQGVQSLSPTSPKLLRDQLTCLLDDIPIRAAKVGMIYSAELIDVLCEFTLPNLIVDPVLISTSGDSLQHQSCKTALLSRLFPRATLITPNKFEAESLTGMTISTESALKAAAKRLAEFGAQAILIKGGHSDEETCLDLLYLPSTNDWHYFHKPRVATNNTHGTGCTLSAAICAYLAHGHDLAKSCQMAKSYVHNALIRHQNRKIGQGFGPVA